MMDYGAGGWAMGRMVAGGGGQLVGAWRMQINGRGE